MPEKPVQDKPNIRMIAVSDLIPTPDNTRFFYPPGSLESLAESLKKVGMQQPVVCRPHPTKEGKFDLRAGERRWRAAKMAGFKEIPASVADLNDQEAMEITATENLHRENLHPLEEAEAIEKLVTTGHTYATIGVKLGKPEKWVARRAQIAKLSKNWKKAIRDPKQAFVLFPAMHLEKVARLPHETQDRLLDEIANDYSFKNGEIPTMRELDRDINNGMSVLRLAIFKQDDATLLPKAGACTNCTKRSGCHPLLFDEFEQEGVGGKTKKDKDERCLDVACFEAKTVAALIAKAAAVKEETGKCPLFVTEGISGQKEDLERALGGKIIESWNVHTGKATDKGAVPAIHVNGSRIGQRSWVLTGKAESSGRRGSGKRAKGAVMSLAQRRTALKERRQAYVVRAVRERIEKLGAEELAELCNEHIDIHHVAALAAVFGTEKRLNSTMFDGKTKDWDSVKALKGNATAVELLKCIIPVFSGRLNFYNNTQVAKPYADAELQCKLFRINFKQLNTEAEQEIPELKGWANLKADGSPKDEAAKATKKKSA